LGSCIGGNGELGVILGYLALSLRPFPVYLPVGEFVDFPLRIWVSLFAAGPAECLLRSPAEGFLDDLDDALEAVISGAVGTGDVQERGPGLSAGRLPLLPRSVRAHLLHRIL
jgi:hypothetical protein